MRKVRAMDLRHVAEACQDATLLSLFFLNNYSCGDYFELSNIFLILPVGDSVSSRVSERFKLSPISRYAVRRCVCCLTFFRAICNVLSYLNRLRSTLSSVHPHVERNFPRHEKQFPVWGHQERQRCLQSHLGRNVRIH